MTDFKKPFLLMLWVCIFFIAISVIFSFKLGERDAKIEQYKLLTDRICILGNKQTDLTNDIIDIYKLQLGHINKLDCNQIREVMK